MEHPTLRHLLPSAGRTHQRRRLLLPKRSTRDLIAAWTPVEAIACPKPAFDALHCPSWPPCAKAACGRRSGQSVSLGSVGRDPSNRREGRLSRRQDRSISTGTGRLDRRSSPAAPPDVDDPAAKHASRFGLTAACSRLPASRSSPEYSFLSAVIGCLRLVGEPEPPAGCSLASCGTKTPEYSMSSSYFAFPHRDTTMPYTIRARCLTGSVRPRLCPEGKVDCLST